MFRVGLSLLFYFMVAQVPSSLAHQHGARSFNVEDQLTQGWIGSVLVDPSGRIAVYERVESYAALADYSIGRFGAWNAGGGELYTVQLGTAGRARPLLPSLRAERYWIDQFSPDGRYLSVLRVQNGSAAIGIVELSTRRAWFTEEFQPRFNWINGLTSSWADNQTFVYASTAGNRPPADLLVRRATGEAVSEAWANAWRGDRPTSNTVATRGLGSSGAAGALVRVNVRSHQTSVMARGSFIDLNISPNGQLVAALREEGAASDPPQSALELQSGSLMILDLQGRSLHEDVENLGFPETLAWSVDGSRLAMFSWNRRSAATSGRFRVWNASTPSQTSAIEHRGLNLVSQRERGGRERPERAIWLGERLAVYARAAGAPDASASLSARQIRGRGHDHSEAPAGWHLLQAEARAMNLTSSLNNVFGVPIAETGDALMVLASGDVWLIRPGQAPLNLTHDGRLVFPSARLFGHAKQSRERNLMVSAPTSGNAYLIRRSPPFVESLAGIVPNTRLLGAFESSGASLRRRDTNGGTELLLLNAQRVRVVDTLNQNLAEVVGGRWRPLEYELGGRRVTGCLLIPSDLGPGETLPVIVDVYPGRVPRCVDAERPVSADLSPGPFNAQLLASHRYVVFVPAIPADAISNDTDPFGNLTSVVVSGLDALRRFPFIDLNRVGLMGYSQGGYSALRIAMESNRFRAITVINGWSDPYSHYFQGHPFYSLVYGDEYPLVGEASRYRSGHSSDFSTGRSPSEATNLYTSMSPMLFARRITAPTLLIHTDMDGFPVNQAEQMFTALQLAGRSSMLVRYFGEGHGPSSPANIRDMWCRIFRWNDHFMEVSLPPSHQRRLASAAAEARGSNNGDREVVAAAQPC